MADCAPSTRSEVRRVPIGRGLRPDPRRQVGPSGRPRQCAAFSSNGLTAPEAVSRPSHCMHRLQSARVAGPRLVRTFANVGLSAWELACHAMPTTVFAAQRPFTSSVSARLRPPQTMPSGTQRARLAWSDPSRARYGHLAAGCGLPGTRPLDR